MAADTYEAPKHGWTCFHCGETFTTAGSARDHFGYTQYADPGCIIDKVALEEDGKPERGRGLLIALRKAEADLARYREEDTELHREIHRLNSEHQQALLREEEKGYARGLRDAWKHPKDSGYQLVPVGATVVAGTLASKPPCTVCGTSYEKHGSYPTCASHPYTADGKCQHVGCLLGSVFTGAPCPGAECKNRCARGRVA